MRARTASLMQLILTLAFAVLGSVLASFAGVIAERIHTGQSFLKGRSRCNSCNRYLAPRDLVPVFSWLLARGRCRTCSVRIPGLYALTEAFLGAAFALTYWTFGLTLVLPFFLLALFVLTFTVLYDLRHTIVPQWASTTLTVLGLIIAALNAQTITVFGTTVLTAGIIALAFFLLYALSRGRAMGLGDTPIAFALSLMVAPYAVAGLLFSFWIGAIVGMLILFMRRGGPRMGIEVPFVPFLALGYVVALFIQWNPLSF
jgi:prepilin signal peptidase PulO-like enzyme (type II secretory pathway)